MPLPAVFRDFRTYITLVSLSIGIFGLYHYYESVQVRLPTYYVSPARARIVDTSVPRPPQLQVLYKGKELNANVSAVTVYLWNAGKLPIKAEDVLEPIKIELDPTCEIIEARILTVTREVTKLAKGDVSDSAKNVLPLSFGILEHNDGVILQVIYTGKPDTTVSATGTVVGVDGFEKAQERAHADGRRLVTLSKYINKIFMLFSIVAVTVVLVRRQVLAERFGKTKFRTLAAFAVFNLIAYTFVNVIDYRESQPVVPASLWSKQ